MKIYFEVDQSKGAPLEGEIRRQHSWSSRVDGWQWGQTAGWKLDNFVSQPVLIEMEMNHQIKNENIAILNLLAMLMAMFSSWSW